MTDSNLHNIQLDNAYIGEANCLNLRIYVLHYILVLLGHEVVLVKNGCRICGTGGALASAPLVQSKSYFEVKIQQSGKWSVGLATRKTDLNKPKGGLDKESWCLSSDNLVSHDSQEIHKLSMLAPDISSTLDNINGTKNGAQTPETGVPMEGDTLGIAYDHIELNFYLNGKKLDIPVVNVKGTVFPALYGKPKCIDYSVLLILSFFLYIVDDGAILDIILDNFNFSPPPGFDRIMIEQSLL